ncbi:T3SS (YopN, CesT) and YbjN peptide-binding chaperone 1 [Nocardioides marmoribigeumensis]|uniref:Uncharacterized protein n=1 Tax=Nocardioides marmoribigeumensis TaxID=433649 RepID=A0ABU2BY96_9ACTN|nr:hypothetical protein [Nocardioides marmoribigeumensis]MDR7363371.1 hypothetical protein [Nocardioides marmoribigeumensis]
MNDNTSETNRRDAELDELWNQLEAGLSAYLVRMTDPDEQDHLLLEVPDPYDDGCGCPPYAQFAAFGDGLMVRAEISGNAYLRPQFHLDRAGQAVLTGFGWLGHDEGEPNWFVEVELGGVEAVASQVVTMLRDHFGVAHPQLLTHQAWGPAAEHVDLLGLCATGDVPEETVATPAVVSADAVFPDGPAELNALVAEVLRAKYQAEPKADDDGDFVIPHLGQPVFVRARDEQPAVEVIARVAHGAYSRRTAAVEVGLLNRDHGWVRWELHDRDVFLRLLIPAMPFVPRHLDDLLDVFLEKLSETRDDLALRLRAKVA